MHETVQAGGLITETNREICGTTVMGNVRARRRKGTGTGERTETIPRGRTGSKDSARQKDKKAWDVVR